MSSDGIKFISHDPSFKGIIGDNPSYRLLAESPDGLPLYHEACIYHPSSNSVYVTSNQIPNPDGSKYVSLTRVYLPRDDLTSETSTIRTEVVTPSALSNSMLNGGVNYDDNNILMCAQGSPNPRDLSGLVVVSTEDHSVVGSPIISTFHGTPFNSVNDVVIHPNDGSIWFTDPCYGYHQGIRNKPQLPNQVYRYDPKTNSCRAVAEGFTRPNGICFSPDLKIVYITDTGAIHGSADVPIDLAGPSHIYAFDLVQDKFLANRRLFAYAPGRFPDGIKCDIEGNVYSGCGDGVEVWNKEGVLIGTIECGNGVANFCFGKNGDMFLCNESKFWAVQLKGEGVKGALLGL